MRILFIVPYTPSLIRVRPYQLIRSLVKLGHPVTLLTLWGTEEDRAALEEIEKQGVTIQAFPLTVWRSLWNCSRALFGRTPFQAVYCQHPALARKLDTILRQSPFDVVHIEHLRGARFGLEALRLLRDRPVTGCSDQTPAVVWDSVDCISHLFEQASRQSKSLKGRCMTAVELGRTRRYEARLMGQFDHVLVTSDIDRKALEKLSGKYGAGQGPAAPVTVLPNGVDLDYFEPCDQPRWRATLVFTGKMSYHANVTAVVHLVREIMPRVWARRSDVRLMIVGKDPTREVRSLADGSKDRVIVTGSVPDLRPYLWNATAAVVPLVYGAGIQNKVLEAMACATPVVASPRAIGALGVRSGEDVLVGEEAEEFASRVVQLLECPELALKLGQAGLAYVRTRHDWNRVAEELVQTYRTARDSRAGARPAA